MTMSMLHGITLFLVFASVIAFIEGLHGWWRSSRTPDAQLWQRRLRNLSAGGGATRQALASLRRAASPGGIPDTWLLRWPRLRSLDRLLEQAGSTRSLPQWLFLQVGLAVLLTLLFWGFTAWPPVFSGALASVLGLGLPIIWLLQIRERRQSRLTRQLPDTMDFLARGLRAGNPFTAALHAAAREMPAPIRNELAITFDEINYGLEVEDALRNLQGRIGGADIAFFVTTVLLQRRTGGNLAEILNGIATLLRDRARTAQEVRIQAAEMRLSAIVLLALPLVVGGFLTAFRGEYMATLFEHPWGKNLLLLQGGWMLLGYLMIRSMVRMRI